MIHGSNLQPCPRPAADTLGLNSGLNWIMLNPGWARKLSWARMSWGKLSHNFRNYPAYWRLLISQRVRIKSPIIKRSHQKIEEKNIREKKMSYFMCRFLYVTVSLFFHCSNFSWLCIQSWDLYAQTKKLCISTPFTVCSACFTHIIWFFLCDFFSFLCKISKLKVQLRNKINI